MSRTPDVDLAAHLKERPTRNDRDNHLVVGPEVAKLYENRDQVMKLLKEYSSREVHRALKDAGINISRSTLFRFAQKNARADRPATWIVDKKISAKKRKKDSSKRNPLKRSTDKPDDNHSGVIRESEPTEHHLEDSNAEVSQVASPKQTDEPKLRRGSLIDVRPFLKMSKEEKLAHRLKFLEEDVEREAERDRRVEIILNEMDRK